MKRIDFKYDEVKFERFYDHEATYAKVRINEKWGVINNRGNELLEIKYDSLIIKPEGQMALVEYEKGRFGYKKFNGEEYFKRKNYQ